MIKLSSTVEAIFAGGIALLEPEGHRTGMFKRQVVHRITVTSQGIEGDQQADRRVHGGPEKAVHHFPAENYVHLSRKYPQCAKELTPGSLGENLSTRGLNEGNVHIGDVFRVGDTLLQVSQPRSPCWKINHRFGIDDLSVTVARDRVTGWYYRVLRPGSIGPEDSMELVDRQTNRLSIFEFWRIQLEHRPSVDELVDVANVQGLSAEWKNRFMQRAAWLKQAGIALL